MLDREIRKITAKPEIGQEKKGTLKGVRIHKFHIKNHLFLLAYELKNDIINLIMLGPHENYYRNLERYYKE